MFFEMAFHMSLFFPLTYLLLTCSRPPLAPPPDSPSLSLLATWQCLPSLLGVGLEFRVNNCFICVVKADGHTVSDLFICRGEVSLQVSYLRESKIFQVNIKIGYEFGDYRRLQTRYSVHTFIRSSHRVQRTLKAMVILILEHYQIRCSRHNIFAIISSLSFGDS